MSFSQPAQPRHRDLMMRERKSDLRDLMTREWKSDLRDLMIKTFWPFSDQNWAYFTAFFTQIDALELGDHKTQAQMGILTFKPHILIYF